MRIKTLNLSAALWVALSQRNADVGGRAHGNSQLASQGTARDHCCVPGSVWKKPESLSLLPLRSRRCDLETQQWPWPGTEITALQGLGLTHWEVTVPRTHFTLK
jgi:hypothetical protein